ncbi:MAG: DUF5915 domain-containing protein, partial [Rothia sp. (in: high G+C Gram-positive bacteria)]|nr:DUF5915 domain-containing protein [Rothia sp. (in: high G+C Gram-positive bacteria)]
GVVYVGMSAADGGFALEPQEYSLETVVAESEDSADRAVSVLPGSGFIVLNTALTAELQAEGIARDTIRAIQQARKDADLHVSDRIRLTLEAPSEIIAAVTEHQQLVCNETLAESIIFDEASEQSILVEKV